MIDEYILKLIHVDLCNYSACTKVFGTKKVFLGSPPVIITRQKKERQMDLLRTKRGEFNESIVIESSLGYIIDSDSLP